MRTRDCFGYMEPDPPVKEFAQCGTCKMWLKQQKLCYWLSDKDEVAAGDSCVLYVQGPPFDQPKMKATGLLEPKDVGFIKGKVRCENCNAFNQEHSGCRLFNVLNKMFPQVFKLDVTVDKHGCCNAFERGAYSPDKFRRTLSLLSNITNMTR